MSLDNLGVIEGTHNSTSSHRVEVLIGDTPMSFETGRIAKQADGAIWIRWGDSVVLTTVCAASHARDHADFLPLTCEYLEKTYAAGKIPGGFFKREARPREHEILNARIADRSIRPLFPDGYYHEVQVISTVLSHDGVHDTDMMALCGASMALHVSSIPFAGSSGPIAGVRVGRKDGKLIANPTLAELDDCDINVVVSASKDAIIMVEGGSEQVSETELIDALFFAHQEAQKVIEACHEMRKEIGKEKVVFQAPQLESSVASQVAEIAMAKGLQDAVTTQDKKARYAAIDQVKADTMAALSEAMGEESFADNKPLLSGAFADVKSSTIRKHVIASKTRIDGRSYSTIRPICSEVSTLPRPHGSAIFTRGETQAVVTTTLGSRADEQKLDGLLGESWRRFMLHYNFPPFCTGEAKFLRGTSRREIGHGALAERAVSGAVPSSDDFPYTIRVVSEITESNGSSSMASVCGATLSMMDAGVPIKSPVAGIAMGLIQEGKDIAVLSDILGDEDHIGDMDFKVCGTEKGITAIQMDIKIDGLTREILADALSQAKEGRLHILSEMSKAIDGPRPNLPAHAPRMLSLRINPDKIRDIIGPGGKTIREISTKTGAKIDIEDDGTVQVFASNDETASHAKQIIEDLTREPEVNMVYKGLVRKCVDFGAFVEIFPGTDGLVHISELADKRVEKVTDILEEGDEVLVKVLSIDRDGKIRLSRRQAQGKTAGVLDVE
jgi:polyribonucleotide nucleotidyltransferase